MVTIFLTLSLKTKVQLFSRYLCLVECLAGRFWYYVDYFHVTRRFHINYHVKDICVR